MKINCRLAVVLFFICLASMIVSCTRSNNHGYSPDVLFFDDDATHDDENGDDISDDDSHVDDSSDDATDDETQPDDSGDDDTILTSTTVPTTTTSITTTTNFGWVSIPGGTFQMGCVPQDTNCNSNETPRHSVTISAFEMTAMEITQNQFEAVMGTNPSYHSDCADCPVEEVTWDEARIYCADVGGRLPTEAEWEYAARAGTTTIYYCGDNPLCLDSIAWYGDISGATHSVGGKETNNFGLYDMLGNVWEWCADWFDVNYYSSSPSQDPQGPTSGTYRVVRGGGWDNNAGFLRASFRGWFGPTDRSINIGCRCVRD